MSDLKQQADELGIKVDGRWSDERLQQEIDKALEAPARPEPFGGKGDHDGDGKPGGTVVKRKATRPFVINRDFWTADPNGGEAIRNRKGTIVELDPSDDAVLDQLQAGAISTVKA